MNTLWPAGALFTFWLALVESTEPVILGFGLIFSVVLGHVSGRLLWRSEAPSLTLAQAVRLLFYLPHLIKCVVMSALQVAEVVLDWRMPIEPVLVTHRTAFTREVSRIAYANSITLTPGTLTVDVEDSVFLIHCLHERFTVDIASGDLERRITRVFEE